MAKKFKVKREKVLEAALSLLGKPFVHQGRTETGVDCVGLLVYIGERINYPDLVDAEAYRRTPSADTIRQILLKNCDEIGVNEAKPGDIFLMRVGGIKPRHCSIYLSDEFDLEKGIEPTLIHAAMAGVKIQPLSDFPQSWFVSAFRIRGIVS